MVGCTDQFGTELQDAAVCRILFDDLDALTGRLCPPVPLVGMWKEFAQGGKPFLGRFEHLADQVFFERQVIR